MKHIAIISTSYPAEQYGSERQVLLSPILRQRYRKSGK